MFRHDLRSKSDDAKRSSTSYGSTEHERSIEYHRGLSQLNELGNIASRGFRGAISIIHLNITSGNGTFMRPNVIYPRNRLIVFRHTTICDHLVGRYPNPALVWVII
jgi:hypothetical protein